MTEPRLPSVVGLDMGATGLRGASLEWDRGTGGYRIERVASVELPPGAFAHGAPIEERPLVRALRALWRRGRFRSRKAVVGLADSGLITRQVDLPWMPEADFAAALRFQVGDVLPVDPATTTLGYHVLDRIPAAGQPGRDFEQNRILLVAADRTSVLRIADVLRKARLEPYSADSTAFALVRAAQRGRIATEGVRAIADVGADHVTVSVSSAGQPILLRTVADIGGAAATSEIARRLDLEPADAERLKRATGLNGPPPDVAPLPESSVFGALPSPVAQKADARTEEVIAILNGWATTVVSEIRNSLDYVRSADPSISIDRLALMGRAIELDGMVERIATQIPVPLEQRRPFLGLESSRAALRGEPEDMRMAAAIGLGMMRPR